MGVFISSPSWEAETTGTALPETTSAGPYRAGALSFWVSTNRSAPAHFVVMMAMMLAENVHAANVAHGFWC
jgi:hypothetical protein